MRHVTWVMVLVLAFQGSGMAVQTDTSAAAQQNASQQALKAKSEVQKRGVGKHSRVRVIEVGGIEIKGFISKISDDSFEVTDNKTGKVEVIPYRDVKKVKGPGLSKAENVVIGIGIGIAVLVALFYAIYPKT